VFLALVGSAAWAVVKVRAGSVFEVTVVLRVSEGRVSERGALGRGKLRAYVNDLAFTKARLIALMSAHPRAFPRAATDPSFAVQTFRENMTLEIAENDFVEEHQRDDPPGSARLLISYSGSDPELTWQIAQELAALVAESTLAGQRAALDADLLFARAEANAASDAVTELEREGGGGPNLALAQARQRLLSAQQRAEEANIALRALAQRQVLRFEIVDKGRVPQRPSPVRVGVKTFVVTAFLSLLGGCLLAGAFDPRVLDEADVADIGMPILGRLPRVAPRADHPADSEQPRERPSLTSGISDPRV
jgi:hypothetical protein